jgi:CHRD domain-containing protein
MPRKILKSIAVLGAALLMGAAVQAKDVALHLTGDQEVPPTSSTATGTGTLTIKKDGTVTGTIKTTGIVGTVAHVHLAAVGKNGPPIITLVKKSDDVWAIPDNSKLTDEQYKSFQAGELYVNVHSDAHKGGEIRAQLKP